MQFVSNHYIDRQQWDECIDASPHGLIYAQSFYLDTMAPGWNALVGDAYEWVMPLTARKKYGIKYLYQPAFTQQLGVFAKQQSNQVPFNAIAKYLKNNFRFLEVNFNYATPVVLLPGFQNSAGTNFILPLQQGYAHINERYHSVLKKNLKKAQHAKLTCKPFNNHTKCIEEYAASYGGRMKHVTPTDFKNFNNICHQQHAQNQLVCRAVTNAQNQLMATAVILSDGKRLYNMMNTPTAEGRKVQANHFLIDAVIQEFAGQNLLFDFEGSDLPGVKSFYESFNAINQPYFMMKYDNLPWPLLLFK